MNIFLTKRLLRIICFVLFLQNIFQLNFKIFADENYFTNSQSIILLSDNSINLDINNLNNLLEILHKYDLKNLPRKVTNDDGSTSYLYRRNENEPKKTIKEIKEIIKNPPKMEKYQNFIRKAFLKLIINGIKIKILDLNNKDISAQWIFKQKQININKSSLIEGSESFAYLLSHEMIHISQSCNGGGFNYYPVLLGLNADRSNKFFLEKLENPIYKELSNDEIKLEIEAYSNQKNLLNTLRIFKYFCINKK